MSPGRLINEFIAVIEKATGETLFHNERPLMPHDVDKLFAIIEEYRRSAINQHVVDKFGVTS